MEGWWAHLGLHLHKVMWLFLLFQLQMGGCFSINLEGMALLEFRSKVEFDPHGALESWNLGDDNPCNWLGVRCVNGKVAILDLKGLSLSGMLVPELGQLTHLRALILYKNNFNGVIPKEIGRLNMLEILDLRSNKLSGKIPEEIGEMLSLRQLLLHNNSFHEDWTPLPGKFTIPSRLKVDQSPSLGVDAEISCLNNVGGCLQQRSLRQMKKANHFMIALKGNIFQRLHIFLMSKYKGDTSHCYAKKHGCADPYIAENACHYAHLAHRRLLQEANNLPAAPANGSSLQQTVLILSIGSGSFPAVTLPTSVNGKDKQAVVPVLPSVPPVHSVNGKDKQAGVPVPPSVPPVHNPPMFPVKPTLPAGIASKPSNSMENQSRGSRRTWVYLLVLPGAAFLLAIAAVMLMFRMHGGPTIGPWRTGLSGPLQKALVAGVPKLNLAELEAACEDFSNIIQTFPDCTVYKGTLSSGVEIAVVSSAIVASKDWSKLSEMLFHKKIDSLSRVNHKNFVNLLGYCVENVPFTRIMVFEYAPSGTLFEHLHVKEHEHLDWDVRMRIIMGIACCLQYMHHELKPSVVHPNLRSNAIYLTDDYAAKIAEIGFWKEFFVKEGISADDSADLSEAPSTHPGRNIYDFGILLLEIISGRHPYSDEQGCILNWAVEYLNDKRSISHMIDPTLQSFKSNELDVVCEVIQDCVHQDPRSRPTMKEVISKLRDVISISPESAAPRLSPLWWAELEILSVEAC